MKFDRILAPLRKAFPASLLAAFLLAPSYARTIDSAASKADTIVIGSVSSWIVSPHHVSFDIEVESILKGGSLPRSVHVEHAWARTGLLVESQAPHPAHLCAGCGFSFAWTRPPGTSYGCGVPTV